MLISQHYTIDIDKKRVAATYQVGRNIYVYKEFAILLKMEQKPRSKNYVAQAWTKLSIELPAAN